MLQKLMAFAVVLAFAFLTACGGGNDGTAPAPAETYNDVDGATPMPEGGEIHRIDPPGQE